MNAIKVSVTVTPDGQLRVQSEVQPGLAPGEYQGVLVLAEQVVAEAEKSTRPPLDFPVDDWGPWPEGLSLRREDMYGDDGR